MYKILQKAGFYTNLNDKLAIEQLVRPILRDVFDVDKLNSIFHSIGVRDPMPVTSNRMDFNKLKGPSIRLFNKIIKYLEKTNEIDDVEAFLGHDKIDSIEVVSKGKYLQISNTF